MPWVKPAELLREGRLPRRASPQDAGRGGGGAGGDDGLDALQPPQARLGFRRRLDGGGGGELQMDVAKARGRAVAAAVGREADGSAASLRRRPAGGLSRGARAEGGSHPGGAVGPGRSTDGAPRASKRSGFRARRRFGARARPRPAGAAGGGRAGPRRRGASGGSSSGLPPGLTGRRAVSTRGFGLREAGGRASG